MVCRDGALRPKDAAQPAAIVVEMSSPYVVAKAAGQIAGEDAKVEVSTDQKTWKPADLANLTAAVAGKYAYCVRRHVQQAGHQTGTDEHRAAQPVCTAVSGPGQERRLRSRAANPAELGENRLVVTYAYCLGSRSATPEQLFDRGAEIARAHNAAWADKPIVVQKTVDKFPCTFEIDVPTPKGKQPVYPRMLFLRREVLAPGQKPADVPAPPSTPAVGAERDAGHASQPVADRHAAAAEAARAADRQGVAAADEGLLLLEEGRDVRAPVHQVAQGQLRRLDPAGRFRREEAARGEAAGLGQADRLRARGPRQGPMQAAAVLLDAAFEPGKPYDFAKLGQNLGTTVVEKGNGPDAPFVPPRRYEIDVTKAIRAWAQGTPCHGLALRIVPNRGVDDGWTVRFTPAKDKPVELEIVTFAEK